MGGPCVLADEHGDAEFKDTRKATEGRSLPHVAGPECTDNFQITIKPFKFQGLGPCIATAAATAAKAAADAGHAPPTKDKNGDALPPPPQIELFVFPGFEGEERDYLSCEQAWHASKFATNVDAATEKKKAVQAAVPGKCPISDGNDDPEKEEGSVEFGIRVWKLGQTEVKGEQREDWDAIGIEVMLLANVAKYAAHPELQEELRKTGSVEIYGQSNDGVWEKWNPIFHMVIRKMLNDGEALTAMKSLNACLERLGVDLQTKVILKSSLEAQAATSLEAGLLALEKVAQGEAKRAQDEAKARDEVRKNAALSSSVAPAA